MGTRVAAIIPANGYSRRLPNKNMRLFLGRPLVVHTIEQALASETIDDVFVSTDREHIQSLCESWGACVPFLRAQELCADDVHGSVPILDMLDKVGGADKYAFCVFLLPTSPLRKARTIDGVVLLAQKRQTNVLSVVPSGHSSFHFRTLAHSGELQPLAQGLEGVYNAQSGDLLEVFCLGGAAECAPVEALLRHRTFQYGSPLAYLVDPIEALDIDTERDFEVAERLASLL